MYEKKGRYIVEFQDIPKARRHHIEIDVEDRRGNYKEVELGFDEERALQEAKRCLSCRRCLGCALCWAECKPEAIDFEMQDEIFDLEADAVIVSPGLERPIEKIDKRYGFGTSLNVITDLQLERMLSETGPSGGLVIRPFDGEIPSSIAFVQSYESASPQMHKAAVSLAVNEAILVRGRLEAAEIQVLARDLDPMLPDIRKAVEGLDRFVVLEGVVESVAPLENQSLKLAISTNGTSEEKSFDLVVLMTQPRISRDALALAKALGLSLSYASFVAGEGDRLLSTEKDSIKLTRID
jgi:heterodisulfide reductase subunit A-like polyferredoxin